MPARQCDLDHHQPWSQGGATEVDNLPPECRHDHRVKHEGGWILTKLAPETYQWTSPLGHTYITRKRDPPH